MPLSQPFHNSAYAGSKSSSTTQLQPTSKHLLRFSYAELETASIWCKRAHLRAVHGRCLPCLASALFELLRFFYFPLCLLRCSFTS